MGWVNDIFKKIIKLFLRVLVMVPLFSVNVFAKDNSLSINAFVYEFDSKSSYEISETASNNDLDPFGTLNITGKVKNSSETDNSEIIVNDGQTTIFYFSSSKKLTNSDEKWHLSSDKTKKVDVISLGDKIKKGVAIVQTSPDKVN